MNDDKQNCKNCGAPLDPHGDCEYCGTKRQRRIRSQMEITSNYIRIYADDHCVWEGESEDE